MGVLIEYILWKNIGRPPDHLPWFSVIVVGVPPPVVDGAPMQSSVWVESQRLGERQSNKVSASFLENTSFIECALREISGAWVDTKSRIIEATCISSGDRGQPCVTSCSQCEQQKPWWRPVNKAIVVLCVRTCLKTQLTMELNQKLTKNIPKTLHEAFTWRENTYVRTWRLKRGEGICSKGAHFQELKGTRSCAQTPPSHKKKGLKTCFIVLSILKKQIPCKLANHIQCSKKQESKTFNFGNF